MARFNFMRFAIIWTIAGFFTLAMGTKSVGRRPIDDASLIVGGIMFPLGLLLLLPAAFHMLWRNWRDDQSDGRRGFDVVPPNSRSPESG